MGTQKSLLSEVQGIMRLSENPIYTDRLFASVNDGLTLLTSFPDKTDDGCVLAGSFARYLTGNGDPRTNWHIREKAAHMITTFIHEPENVADFARIASADQDIDTAFVFKNNGSLDTLYALIKSNAPQATEYTTTAKALDGRELITRHLQYTDAHHTQVDLEFGPIRTNPNLIHMTMGFYQNNQRLFHIDIAKFPSDGMETLDQKRIGGDTNQAQDIYIRLSLDDQNNSTFMLDPKYEYSVLHKESIDTMEKEPNDITELAIRALRIHLIHSEKLFTDMSPKTLTALFYTEGKGNLFEIRKTIQTLIRQKKEIPKEQMDLFRTELLICMANDPYETAKFLQDTGIYLLIPGMSNFTHQDWKNFFTSTAFTFLQEGRPILAKGVRSMDSVQYSHEEFLKVKWNDGVNGIQRFIRAFGEVMKQKIPDLDLKNYDHMYTLLFKSKPQKISLSETQHATSLQNMLLYLFRSHPSGVTEREMQGYLQTMTNGEISRDLFQKTLFQIKSRGLIDRQTRLTSDGNKVVFYSPRLNKHGDLDMHTTPLTHQEIQDAISHMELGNISGKARNVLEQLLQQLPCRSIESFRPLREYERDMLAQKIEEELQKRNDIMIATDDIKLFIARVQQACISFSRKRGL